MWFASQHHQMLGAKRASDPHTCMCMHQGSSPITCMLDVSGTDFCLITCPKACAECQLAVCVKNRAAPAGERERDTGFFHCLPFPPHLPHHQLMFFHFHSARWRLKRCFHSFHSVCAWHVRAACVRVCARARACVCVCARVCVCVRVGARHLGMWRLRWRRSLPVVASADAVPNGVQQHTELELAFLEIARSHARRAFRQLVHRVEQRVLGKQRRRFHTTVAPWAIRLRLFLMLAAPGRKCARLCLGLPVMEQSAV